MNGLFLDSPSELEKRVGRLVEHFRHAEFIFFQSNPKGLPTPSGLLWILLQDAMHTARNTPDLERRMVSRVGSAMPSTRVTDNAAYQTELSRLLDGIPQFDAKEVRSTVNEAAVDRMVDVLDLLRLIVGGRRGKDVARMKRVVLARAAGLTIEQCGRIWDRSRIDFDRRSFHDIKSRVLGQLLAGIETHFWLKRTSRGFRRLTMREIERQTKARKRQEADANAG